MTDTSDDIRRRIERVEVMQSDTQRIIAENTLQLARPAWQDAQEFKRQSPTVLEMASVLGLTDAQIDELFITAAGIGA